MLAFHRSAPKAFTLVELLVSTAVLSLLLLLILQLFNSAAAVTAIGNKHMDADAQARGLLDRMSIDFGGMAKRTDIDYFLKGTAAAGTQTGNDQIAFFSEVLGYPGTGTQSPVSLVAYRLNSTTLRIERLGKGLVWNGDATANIPVVFLPLTIAATWPQATNMAADPSNDYEQIGPQVFRFEYYYVLNAQAPPGTGPSTLSAVPWDSRAPLAHTSVNGLQDVAAIGVALAIIDPKSRVLVSNAQLTTLAGAMSDFDPSTMVAGGLEGQWQTAVNASALPRVAASAIRIYGRCFYLNSSNR